MRWVLWVCTVVGCSNVDSKNTIDARSSDASPPMLDAPPRSEDFVVNTSFANNQFLSNDFEAVGLQLATANSNNWTVAFRGDCTSCSILGRRFDASGAPLETLGAGTNEFVISTTATTSGSIPALAASGTTTLAVWDFFDTSGTGQGVACRALDDAGGATPAQLTISTDPADVVTAHALSNGDFVVTWQSFLTSMSVIRSIIVKPDCTTLTASPITVSTTSGSLSARRSDAAASGAAILYAWVVDGDVRVRMGANDGTLLGTEAVLIPKTATDEIDHVRVAPWGSDFAVAVRWAATSGTGLGKIEVYRVSTTGTIAAGPLLITDQSGSDFASDKAFGIASRFDGTVLVVWHACPTGPGTCDVFGRIVHSSDTLGGAPIGIPTTTAGDQVNPSVTATGAGFAVAWNDSSGEEPDTSGTAVRARLILPGF